MYLSKNYNTELKEILNCIADIIDSVCKIGSSPLSPFAPALEGHTDRDGHLVVVRVYSLRCVVMDDVIKLLGR